MVATNYLGLKLRAKIDDAKTYFSCAWRRDSTFLSTIFSRSVISCNVNRTEPVFELTCIESSTTVTATAAFVSPVQENDSGSYQVRCRLQDLSEIIIAEITIEVLGVILNVFYAFINASNFRTLT